MSQIAKLISQLCPNGVDYVALEALFNLRKGENLTNDQAISGEFPVITASRGSTFFHNDFNFDGECITISSHGAYAGFVSYYNQKFWLGNNVYLFERKSEEISTRFYFHLLKSLAQALLGTVNTGGIPYINAKDLKRLRVPNPPIEIQNKIVKILDTFIELEAELEAELESRKSQYEFFATKLFEESKLEGTCALDEVAELKYGYTDIARDEGDLRFLRITDIDPNGKIRGSGEKFVNSSAETAGYLVKSGDLLMARTGATYGKTALIEADENAVFASFLIRLRFNPEEMLPAFYWHFAQSQDYWRQANKLVSTGGQPQFNGNALKQLVIPLPTLETQKSVIKILDSLNALMNDTKLGLPAEIATRHQQYEHYRTKLLNFKELVVA